MSSDAIPVAMKRPSARRLYWIAASILAGLAAIPFFYLVAALVLGAIPANYGREAPTEGVTIFVRSNGVHTWILVPKLTPEMDWRLLVPGAHLRDPGWGRGDHIALGYGNRTFYLETPTWGDLTMKNAFLAAFGSGRSLMHADHDHRPQANDHQRPILVSRAEYRRLVDYMRAGFQRDAEGRTIPLVGRGYGGSDMFYEAEGPYSAILTCNEWTGRALRHAGLRTGMWTPFAQSIMWRLD